MSEIEKKYSYDRLGVKAVKIGRAALDAIEKNANILVTAEDIVENRGVEYLKGIQKAIANGLEEKFTYPFHVVYLYGKPHWATTVIRGVFVARQTEPSRETMLADYPYWGKDVWRVTENGYEYLWTMPSLENMREIQKNKQTYDESLVEWTAKPWEEKKSYNDKI